MVKERRKARILMILALIVNLVIFVQEVRYFAEFMGSLRTAIVWFTFDSNIFAGVASFIMAFDLIESLVIKRKTAHRGVLLMKYAAVTGVTITFLTVVCYLGPVVKVRGLFAGSGLYAHLLVPLEAFFSFVLLERGAKLKWYHMFIGIIPVLIYGIVYVSLVLNRVWTDHYHLMLTDPWYISIAIVAAAFMLVALVVAGVYALAEKIAGKKKKP